MVKNQYQYPYLLQILEILSGVTRGPPSVLREIPHENKILELGNFKLMNHPIIISYGILSFFIRSVRARGLNIYNRMSKITLKKFQSWSHFMSDLIHEWVNADYHDC